ncbi:lipopolysaccharide assembly protein LapA domain-containing protein [Immundisolibacter sp.]
MRTLRLLALLMVSVMAGLFTSVNTQPVRVNYLVGSGELRLAYLVLGVLGIGMVVGWLAALPRRWQHGRELRRLRAQQRRLEAELLALSSSSPLPPQS